MSPPLAGLRALDLTDALGYLCGRLLVDLGVDVLKVEPPGGDPGRRLEPRHRDDRGVEHGLYWHATNGGKRSVTLDVAHPGARRVLADLAADVDFVVESFPPDSPAAALVADVAAARPWVIHTSITPFGDRPPGRALHGDDLVLWAAGGPMYLCGDADRAPVRVPMWQAFSHAGAEAAVGTMLAHVARGRSGRGQRVVVNAQAAMVWTLMNAQAFPVLHGDFPRRNGVYVGSRGVRRRMIFACADGHVSLLLLGGQGSASTRALMGWMQEQRMLPDWLAVWPWEHWEPGWGMTAISDETQAEIARIEDTVEAFFRTQPKAAIYREGIRRKILVAPVATVADVMADPQLAAREYFRPVDDGALGRVAHPGPVARLSATPLADPRPAPAPGEHNDGVYGALYDADALATLRRDGVV